jgi:hypothetical protein
MDDDIRELLASQTQQLEAIREERTKKIFDTLPKRIAGITAAAAGIVVIATWISDAAHTVAHHDEIDTYIAAEDADHDGVPDVADEILNELMLIQETVESNASKADYLYCSRANRDMERGLVDTLPTECRIEWGEQGR